MVQMNECLDGQAAGMQVLQFFRDIALWCAGVY